MNNNYKHALAWTIPLVFAVFYALWPILGLPQPYYAPETRQIFWHKIPNVNLMGWYGQLVMAGIAAIVVGSLLALPAVRLPASWRKSGPWFAVVGFIAAMIVTAVREVYRWIL